MAEHEFELISGEKIPHIKVFVNAISYRNYHFHDAFELLLVLDGTGRLNMLNEVIPLQKGSLILINPNEAHEIQGNNGSVTALIFQVSRNFCSEYLPTLSEMRFLVHDLSNHPASGDVIDTILSSSAVYLAEPGWDAFSFLAQTICLISRLQSFPLELLNHQDRTLLQKRTVRMNRILDFVEENYARPIRLSDIADREHLTPTYVSHIFSDYLGISFQSYMNNLRYERAVNMLCSRSVTVSEAAYQSGFSDPKYLRRMMKQHFKSDTKPQKDIKPVQSASMQPLETQLRSVDALAEIDRFRTNREL